MVDSVVINDVEVVKLQTFALLLSAEYRSVNTGNKLFNIYKRRDDERTETLEIAVVKDVILLPQPAFKIIGKKYLVDELSHVGKNIIKGVECWPYYGNTWDIRWFGSAERVKKSNTIYFLLGADTNHYHWLLNYLPRLLILKKFSIELDLKEVKLVVPKSLSKSQYDLLEMIGFNQSALFTTEVNRVYYFDELVVPSFFHSRYFSKTVFEWYQSLDLYRTPIGSRSKRILIIRASSLGGSQRRRVVNQVEVAQALIAFGFESVDLADLSMAEQITLFASAEFVIGPHGAGFANIVFSQKPIKSIVFENSYNHTFMLDMLLSAGSKASVLLCDDVIDDTFESEFSKDGDLLREVQRNRDMIINIPNLISLIKEMLME